MNPEVTDNHAQNGNGQSVDSSANGNGLSTHAQGPLMLRGPMEKPDESRQPIRGDLAHIGLAGRYFVPHYAVPQPRVVMPGGAALHSQASEASDEICTLMEGDSFEMLDISGTWAWGCLSLNGPVGYVRIEQLEAVS